ncbi:MAG TPA: hypothetical protein VIJ10_03380 [Vicinamibacteria bacterium]
MGLVLPDRREAIVRLGLAIAGLAGVSRAARAAAALESAGDPILALAARIRDGSRDGAWEAAAEAVRAGARPETLLGAVFLAGAEDIRPRPHGTLHAVMMVESACQLSSAAGAAPRAAWHPALFNLDELKSAQEDDRREWGDYRMKPLAVAPGRSAEAARRELVAALDAYDPERAERAAAGLAGVADAHAFFETLRPFTARCYAFIGHKAIYATQVERVLGRIGWRHAEPAARSLVLALLVGRQTEGHERALELARGLPAGALEPGRSSAGAERADELVRALRTATPTAAAESVAGALRAGLGSASAWDAIVLAGADVFQRRPGRRSSDGRLSLLPVHAVTVPSALRSSFETARDPVTKGVLLLQAASWAARMRDDLGQLVGLSMQGPSLAPAGGRASLDEVLEDAEPASAMGWLERGAGRTGELIAALRASLARRGRESHQHKLAGALGEEAGRVDASLRARLVAPAVDYLANPRDADTEVFLRAERALDGAGIARGA